MSAAPAVHTPAAAAESDARCARMLFDAMVEIRWRHPRDPVLNAWRGARTVVDGWPAFRRGWINQLREVRGYGPGSIAHRISGHRREVMAMMGWREIKRRLRDWSLARGGKPLTARQIIAAFERTYRPRKGRPALRDSVFEIDMRGQSPGSVDGFSGSSPRKRGTLLEIVQDLHDPVVREKTTAMICRDWGPGFGERKEVKP